MGDCTSIPEEAQMQKNENFIMVKYLYQGNIIEYSDKEYKVEDISTDKKFTTLRLVSGHIKQKFRIENEKQVKVISKTKEYNGKKATLNVKCLYWGIDYRKPSILFEDLLETDQENIKKDIEEKIENTKNKRKLSKNCNEVYSVQQKKLTFTYSDGYDKISLVISGPVNLISSLRPYCVKKNEKFEQKLEKEKLEMEIQKATTFLNSKGYKVTKKLK